MSYLKFTKPFDEQAARERIQARIDELNAFVPVWALVLPVLKAWDGKKLNKRLFTQVAAAIGGVEGYNPAKPGGWAVRGGVKYSWYELELHRDKKNPSGDTYSYSVTLHYLSTGVFSYDAFMENTGCWYTEQSTAAEIARCERALAELPGAVKRWNNALAELQAVNEQMDNTPVSYSPFFDINGR